MKNNITIVGPKREKGKKPLGFRSVNIEALLLMAKYDKAFRKRLLEDREITLEESKLEFSEKERAILLTIENKQLQDTIRSFSVPGIKKKSLPNWKTAAAVLVLLSTIAVKEGKSQNITTDSAAVEQRNIVQGLTSGTFHQTISGKVFDQNTQRPIPGVIVLVKGTDMKAQTDKDGLYTIQGAFNDTIVFKTEGYIQIEVRFTGYTEINIALEKEIHKENMIKGINPSIKRKPKKDK